MSRPATAWMALALALSANAARAGDPADATAAAVPDFDRQVRAILSDKCYACHGPDAERRKADLRLDTPEGLFGAGKSGEKAVVAGNLDDSEVYQRLIAEEPDRRMPPAKGGKPLTEAEAATLKAWIAGGAPFRRHWAFQPPVRPSIPAVKRQDWARNPIDSFVLARLEREGLAPAPQADTATLMRRLSLDLIGLPPTLSELDSALGDRGPEPLSRATDRLLDSPRHGERWARIWLDAARYADSDGFEKDKPRNVWFYRDWVINAINRDLPYDRFIVEQIAGDLLPGATQDQTVATGYLRNSMINEEGGADPEQFRMEAMFDRMDAIGKGILGLTIQCAQCHTHKFDPITHDDYYRLFAFLNESHESNVAVYTAADQTRRADLFRQVAEIEDDLKHRTPDWPARMAAWEATTKAEAGPEWVVIRPAVDPLSDGGEKFQAMDDGSLLCQGYAPTKHRLKLTATLPSDLKGIRAFRLEQLNDPNLPLGGPGRSPEGTSALTEFAVEAAPADTPDKTKPVKLVSATADVNPPETPLKSMYDDKSGKLRVTGPVAFAIDDKPETAWGIDVGPARRNQPRQAVFVAQEPISHDAGTALTVYLAQNHGGWNSDDNQNHNLGRFRLSVTTSENAKADPIPAAVRKALDVPAESRTPAQVAAIFAHWRTTVADWKDANDRINALWATHPEGSAQLVLKARETPRMTHVLERGDFLKPGKTVAPGTPGFLNALPADAPTDRLSFARWLVDRRSPTTARAAVNRVWQSYFGTGLVSTSEDLGSQGEAPTHPELLDWLAVEFMDGGWSMKALHKLITESATYRQSSVVSPEMAARDPENRLLARGPRFRVDAEVVRDVALAASGLLDDTIGGPSVFPPAPEFLFQPPASYGPKTWAESKGAGRFRRALYTFRYRSVPYPALQVFDAPNGDFACVRRSRSNTPLQALTTLNEPLALDCARAMALRVLREGGNSDPERIAYAFRLCTGRTPEDRETAPLLALLQRQAKRFGPGGVDPWTLAASDPAKPPALPEGVTPAQAASWTAASRVLLNLDETITKP
ncbi:PSD1 and planctomycete cytochrome C domain-containing protein [Isosphaeraceae bacterium EP7]